MGKWLVGKDSSSEYATAQRHFLATCARFLRATHILHPNKNTEVGASNHERHQAGRGDMKSYQYQRENEIEIRRKSAFRLIKTRANQVKDGSQLFSEQILSQHHEWGTLQTRSSVWRDDSGTVVWSEDTWGREKKSALPEVRTPIAIAAIARKKRTQDSGGRKCRKA